MISSVTNKIMSPQVQQLPEAVLPRAAGPAFARMPGWRFWKAVSRERWDDILTSLPIPFCALRASATGLPCSGGAGVRQAKFGMGNRSRCCARCWQSMPYDLLRTARHFKAVQWAHSPMTWDGSLKKCRRRPAMTCLPLK